MMKNVILLTIDALRRDVLGCYRGKNLTPFMDSIQSKCIRFNNACSVGPYTQASFPAILTSSYYFDHGLRKILSSENTLISEVLKKTGITTAAFHSNPYLSAYCGWNRGWDHFYDSMEEDVDPIVPYISAEKINRKVVTWLSSHVTGSDYRPFFLWLHYMDVHEPYVPEQKYIDVVDQSIRMNRKEMFKLFKDVLLKRDVSDKKTVEILKKLYLAHVREVDEYVQDFFRILEQLDVLKDSWIIITSDHGDEFGEHGGLSHDGKMYSELINVPLIIYDPNRNENAVYNEVVSTIDVSPTIVHLFNLSPFDAFKGSSLLPVSIDRKNGILGEAIDKYGQGAPGTNEVHYYREGDFKIIYQEKTDSWELYNLSDDPSEMRNIASTSLKTDYLKSMLLDRVHRYTR